MPPRGWSKEELKMMREKSKREAEKAKTDFRRNHVYCPECGHTADTFFFSPGDICNKCRKAKFKAYKETVLL